MNKVFLIPLAAILIALLGMMLSSCTVESEWVVYDITCTGGWHNLVANDRNNVVEGMFIYPTGEMVYLPSGGLLSGDPCIWVKTDIQFDGNFQPEQ